MIKVSFENLRSKLSKSRDSLKGQLASVFTASKISDEIWDQIEESLILADVGVETTLSIVDELKVAARKNNVDDAPELWGFLEDIIGGHLQTYGIQYSDTPLVTLFVGVNGSGKTTTIGKFAKKEMDNGTSVALVAGDTFRAAAVDQLKTIADRINAPFIGSQRGADPSSVAYDSIHAAKSRNVQHLLIDTAGRLHSHDHLMAELAKMKRVSDRESEGWAKVQAVLILDATTGQNGLQQALLFNEAIKLDSIVVTKLDGTAKGGILIAISERLQLPVAYIGIGEKTEDLIPFDPRIYASAIFGKE